MGTRTNFAIALLMLASPAFAGSLPAKAPLFTVVPLISNQAGQAKVTDPNLVNPWGLSQVTPSTPLWVSDAGTGLSTVYDQGTGQNTGLVVTIPGGGPTGTVYVSGGGFKITENGKSQSAEFLFDSLSGVISGWNSSVDPTNAVIAYNGSAQGSSYTGLAIDTLSHLLFAADFANNQVQIFDDTFTLKSSFTDTSLPKGFAPFNVAIIGSQVYVAFAQNGGSDFRRTPKKGGAGYVDIFTESGALVKQLIAKGKLDGPWGMAIAPSTFGSFANSLLVGNLDNGMINAYDPTAGTFLGTLSTKKGKPIVISELWALDAAPSGDITFSSGPEGYAAGLVGLIQIKAKKN